MVFEPKEQKEGQETLIGEDVVLNGNLKSSGPIQINGRIKGKVETEADVVIGETAKINGSVKAKNVFINGTVWGNIIALEDLEVNPTGKVFGDILTKNLIIKKGAVFVGRSGMEGIEEPKEKKKDKKAEKS